jgi:hypothetical protein
VRLKHRAQSVADHLVVVGNQYAGHSQLVIYHFNPEAVPKSDPLAARWQ